MKPINFPSANTHLATTNDNIEPMPVYHGQGMYISRWRCTWRERLSILLYGTIWVAIASDNHPPISISGEQAGEFVHPDYKGEQ